MTAWEWQNKLCNKMTNCSCTGGPDEICHKCRKRWELIQKIRNDFCDNNCQWNEAPMLLEPKII